MVGLKGKAARLPRELTQIEMRSWSLPAPWRRARGLMIVDEAMAGLSHTEVDEIVALLLQ